MISNSGTFFAFITLDEGKAGEEMYMDILNRANDYVWHIFRQNEQHKISVTLNRYTFQGE